MEVTLSVLFYSNSKEGAGERLNTVIQTFVPKREIETFETVETLSERLRQPKNDEDIAIFLATSKEELRELLCVGHFLGDRRVILILPDREKDTISKAHTLGPRFLAYADSNFIDVAAVLSKMLSATRWLKNF